MLLAPLLIAVTPKGVEHKFARMANPALGHLLIAVTPKGVEHRKMRASSNRLHFLLIAVTPKGVEHRTATIRTWTYGPADRRDAERR